MLRENLQLGVGGGTQMWSVIRRLTPRDLRLAISAIGFGHVDRVAPHLHPNVLVTLLSLLYPRSTVGLIDSPEFRTTWSLDDGGSDFRRVIVGSCAPFTGDSASAALLGGETTEVLRDARAVGDFLGVFLTPDGGSVEPYPPTATVSHIASADLRAHAKRADTVVALAAAGNAKVEIIRLVLAAELCNVLVTDETTARALLSSARLDRGD